MLRRTRGSAGRAIRAVTTRLGYDVVRRTADSAEAIEYPYDYDDDAKALFERVRPYTLTSHERVVALRDAVRCLVANRVEGDIVECGVWRGGSMLVIVLTLLAHGVTDRDLWLYDTFTHMPFPGEHDYDVWSRWTGDYYDEFANNPFYDNVPADTVRALLVDAGYPAERLHLVAGMVEETIPAQVPDDIALLRLDTDLYESTAHELRHLFPRLVPSGVLIVDDYGHFMGSKRATDEFFASHGVTPLLHRIDATGRSLVVTDAVRSAIIAH